MALSRKYGEAGEHDNGGNDGLQCHCLDNAEPTPAGHHELAEAIRRVFRGGK